MQIFVKKGRVVSPFHDSLRTCELSRPSRRSARQERTWILCPGATQNPPTWARPRDRPVSCSRVASLEPRAHLARTFDHRRELAEADLARQVLHAAIGRDDE